MVDIFGTLGYLLGLYVWYLLAKWVYKKVVLEKRNKQKNTNI